MRRISYFLLFSFICYQSPSIAGDSFDKNNSQFGLWSNLGIGKSYFGPTFQGDISLAISNNIILIGFLKADEFRFSPGGYEYKEPALSIREFSILYGRYWEKEILFYSILGGPSILNGIKRGSLIEGKQYDKVDVNTIGFILKGLLVIRFTENFGLNLSFSRDFNKQNSYNTFIIGLSIGKF